MPKTTSIDELVGGHTCERMRVNRDQLREREANLVFAYVAELSGATPGVRAGKARARVLSIVTGALSEVLQHGECAECVFPSAVRVLVGFHEGLQNAGIADPGVDRFARVLVETLDRLGGSEERGQDDQISGATGSER